jgi:hypothetical protein
MVTEMRSQSSRRPQTSTATKYLDRIGCELQRVESGDGIEGGVGKGKLLHLADFDPCSRQTPAGLLDHRRRRVEPGDFRARLARDEKRAACTAADVEQSGAGADSRVIHHRGIDRPPCRFLQGTPVRGALAPSLTLRLRRAHQVFRT